ncbi:hypothetical protein C7380_1134 [Oceanotoga teriensis]|uniref:Uncharacterized protein n=1 Tax=Oceanotoga teriensis TaxID=515440 RepID=A0AA45C5X2_9BACT|nr:hypothetical protein [Oceanotoga teriensis]PWJ90016.1 hypothetical protein C7380_1134 [Oceanotoga teriensis]
MSDGIEAMVICSTLNQITNYLMIKKYKPKKIYNITYKNDDDNKFDNEKWDEYLKEQLKKDKDFENFENKDWNKVLKYKLEEDKKYFIDIKLSLKETLQIEKIKKRFETLKDKEEEIYWHITGGQRLIAMVIKNIIKDRKKDKILYVEGNTEKLISYDYEFNPTEESYNDNSLNFNQALSLVGFNLSEKNIKKEESKNKDIREFIEKEIISNKEEYKFYLNLYDFFIDKDMGKDFKINKEILNDIKTEKDNINFNEDYCTSFKNALIFSNRIKDKVKRKEFIKEIFEKIKEINKELDFECCDSRFGYIFEKIILYKIISLIQEEDNKISDIIASMKALSNDNTVKGIVDEIDIALLKNTGKIINLECKSGKMDGDNAKSNKYTTYRLSGVFGMPYLVTPLLEGEENVNEKENPEKEKFILKKSIEAFNSAKRAELKVINFNKLTKEIIKIIK